MENDLAPTRERGLKIGIPPPPLAGWDTKIARTSKWMSLQLSGQDTVLSLQKDYFISNFIFISADNFSN